MTDIELDRLWDKACDRISNVVKHWTHYRLGETRTSKNTFADPFHLAERTRKYYWSN